MTVLSPAGFPPRFRHFLAIDWSGAAGERHKGIALALCAGAAGDGDAGDGAAGDGGEAPRLLARPRRWSRAEVANFLLHELPADTLVGMDLGISLPFADEGAFFPGWADSPPDARALWALVDKLCGADPHLGASGFVDHAEASRYFRRHGGREGALFNGRDARHRRGRFRVTEEAQAAMGCKPYSNFNLVGAAQVGKSSLTGMRVLHRLSGKLPIWPIDPLPASGSVVVEIYTAIAAIAAGRSAARAKMTTIEQVNHALANLASAPVPGSGPIDDHSADALVTSAWLRRNAHRPELWSLPVLTPAIVATEGWTFGAT